MTLKDFIMEFVKYDDKGIWELKEIKALYNELINVYGEVTEENFDIEYVLKNKESVVF